MRIIGYCVCGGKQYVAFKEDKECQDHIKITDGFHDREVDYEDYKWVERQDIDLKKIISRMRGASPWHPLLKLLRKESIA